MLQMDARNRTTEEIGEEVGLAGSTVAARIADLEESGIIEGYIPVLNYEKAGYGQHLVAKATLPVEDTEPPLDELLQVDNVVSVRRFLTDDENLSVELVGRSQETIEESIEKLQTLGVEIIDTEIVVEEIQLPFDSFGERFTDAGRE